MVHLVLATKILIKPECSKYLVSSAIHKLQCCAYVQLHVTALLCWECVCVCIRDIRRSHRCSRRNGFRLFKHFCLWANYFSRSGFRPNERSYCRVKQTRLTALSETAPRRKSLWDSFVFDYFQISVGDSRIQAKRAISWASSHQARDVIFVHFVTTCASSLPHCLKRRRQIFVRLKNMHGS